MARKITAEERKRTGEHRYTDHSTEIQAMRDKALHLVRTVDPTTASLETALTIATLDCAAALLEVHDDTGISLDDWRGPAELVNYGLFLTSGNSADHFIKNEV